VSSTFRRVYSPINIARYSPLGLIFSQAQSMLRRLCVLVLHKRGGKKSTVLPLYMQLQWLESRVYRVPFPCTSTSTSNELWYCFFSHIQVKKCLAACRDEPIRVQVLCLGVYRRVSVLEQRRALLWRGPRVLHGWVPRELPVVDEWRPEHQPVSTNHV